MSISQNWIDGVGAVVDAKEALPMLELAVKRLESLAEKSMEEFDFRKFETTVWTRPGLFRAKIAKVVPMFGERMPPSIEKAVRVKFDVREEIVNACIQSRDLSWYWQDDLYKKPWAEFDEVAGRLFRARRSRTVLDAVKSTIGCGLISLLLNEEGFKLFANLKEVAERERVFRLRNLRNAHAVQATESDRSSSQENVEEKEDSPLPSPEREGQGNAPEDQ